MNVGMLCQGEIASYSWSRHENHKYVDKCKAKQTPCSRPSTGFFVFEVVLRLYGISMYEPLTNSKYYHKKHVIMTFG